MSKPPKPEEMSRIDYTPPLTPWMETPVNYEPGCWGYPTKENIQEYNQFPNPRVWSPLDDDWKLPANWKEILLKGMEERLSKYRSFQLFMDICVRCGACADKCHFFIGGGDPKNMPVLRAELMRSIYRKNFTTAGKLLGGLAGARDLTEDVVKEWFYYFYQCTECRRCSVYCPYGIDTAEITMMARELLHLLGVGVNWIMEPVANCTRTGNHLGLQPHAFKGNVDFLVDDIENITGVRIDPSFNRKGAEILFVTPSADAFAEPGIYTMMGYMMLFHELGLDYTMSTYCSEGGNFGLFTGAETMKKLNYKIYAEAKRLGVKWILGGECGHMWRVLHQFMDTMNGPPDHLEAPVSPITGTKFENAGTTKMVHVCEFTADLIKNNKLKLDPSRNDHRTVTFHDSCNPARAMGIFEEPRYIIRSACNNFVEMPENTIKEQTYCCGGGSGLNAGEYEIIRLRGGFPRGNALRYVQGKYGVNTLACICAIDRATLVGLCDYWAPPVEVSGTHELLANALIMEGEQERTVGLRGEPLAGTEE